MGIKLPTKFKVTGSTNEDKIQKNEIQVLIEYLETKRKLIQKRISQNELKLESMVSHTDYEYNDLLRESTESQRDHKKDLQILIDLFCKYNIEIR